MNKFWKKFLSISLSLLMIVLMIPVVTLPTQAAELTSASFISNTEHREYIDMMMEYHLSTNTTLQSTLASGKSVIFMFEGGSDNYPGNGYSESSSNQRNQAVCIVVKQINGVNQIVFYNENSSSLPAQPSYCESDQQTAILDGIYSVYTWNHQGWYGALQIDVNKGLYTPAANRDGVIKSASGINIHTRMNLESGAPASAWSWGCQLIGFGNTTGNAFNEFMKCVANIDFNVWTSWSPKVYTKLPSTGTRVGYYVLDRQLAKDGLASSIYNSNAVATLTAASKTAREEAEALYGSPAKELFPSHGNVTVARNGIQIMSLPCTKAVDANSRMVEFTTESVYEAIGLCRNKNNELWYTVKLKSGNGEGYLYAGDATDFEVINDITISGVSVPETINQGSAASLVGTVSTEYALLNSVGATVHPVGGTNTLTGATATGISMKSVNLQSTKLTIDEQSKPLDYTVEYNKLSIGNYTLKISAKTISYWASSATQLKTASCTQTQVKHFSVVNGNCTHAYSSQVTEPTCTTEGYTTHVCSNCNSSYQSDFRPAIDHSYADATYTAPQTCTVCGATNGTAKTLTSIEVSTLPTKLTYGINEALSVEGGKVTLTADDGTSEVIDLTAEMVTGFDSTVEGTLTLTVTYGGKTATYEIRISPAVSDPGNDETLAPDPDGDDTGANEDPADTDADQFPSEGEGEGESETDDRTLIKPEGCGVIVPGISMILITVAGVALTKRKKEE